MSVVAVHFGAQRIAPPRRRITRVRQLLETCDLPIDQVAQRCGFESTVAFRRRFHDLVHLFPSAYRRAFRGPIS
ncbi:helix-turn-helix domain-containing protein [Amycolatopsis sp. lyj-23]|uniref:helix-turn-helix domain-containing protein n=1 Tax=Amycolatopsis sp. lyj-23 TaxID=2789283 RepID=UPI00397BD5B2